MKLSKIECLNSVFFKRISFRQLIRHLSLFQSGVGSKSGNWRCKLILIVDQSGGLEEIRAKLPTTPLDKNIIFAQYYRSPESEKLEILQPQNTGLTKSAENTLNLTLKNIFQD